LSYCDQPGQSCFFGASSILLFPEKSGEQTGDDQVRGPNGKARHKGGFPATEVVMARENGFQPQHYEHEHGRNGCELEAPAVGRREQSKYVQYEYGTIGPLSGHCDRRWPDHVCNVDGYKERRRVPGGDSDGGENSAAIYDVEGCYSYSVGDAGPMWLAAEKQDYEECPRKHNAC